MSSLERANDCLEALEYHRAALEKRAHGGGALAYWNGKEIKIVASACYSTVEIYQGHLTPAERAASILIPVLEAGTVCVY